MQPRCGKDTSQLPVLSFHISCTVIPVRDPCVADECTYDVPMSLSSVWKQKTSWHKSYNNIPGFWVGGSYFILLHLREEGTNSKMEQREREREERKKREEGGKGREEPSPPQPLHSQPVPSSTASSHGQTFPAGVWSQTSTIGWFLFIHLGWKAMLKQSILLKNMAK